MENIGNIITLLTLLGTIVLGISDISRRRAEARKFNAESEVSHVEADTKMMSEIKQASIDLVEQLRQEKEEFREEAKRARDEARYYKRVLINAGVTYEPFKTGPLTVTKRQANDNKPKS